MAESVNVCVCARAMSLQFSYNILFNDPYGHGSGNNGSITTITYEKKVDMIAVRRQECCVIVCSCRAVRLAGHTEFVAHR